ncbi:MAG: iron-containing alcohol dehydrogenase [Chloroflexi bacterium]|nr:iron-containing alcohol dehydrogenase [Chloroflexota bacterium]
MTIFEFATADRIVFGRGAITQVGQLARAYGKRAQVVNSGSADRAQPVYAALEGSGIAYTAFSVTHEPTIDIAKHAIAQAHELGAQLVIGFGGGAAIDLGKAVAALATNPGDPLDYLEVIGRGKPLQHDPLPYIAVPTTAGTGAEVTRNAVLASTEHRVKVSLRSPKMLPRVALIDPELTVSLPPDVTASTGMDALTQCIEPFVSPAANVMTDTFCRDGIRRAARALQRAYRDGADIDAREDMSAAALMGGLALANAKLGAVHGFAAPIGGMFDAPHGAVCAVLLAPVMRANLRALRERTPGHPSLERYIEIARLVTGTGGATADDGVQWVQALARDLNVPGLSAYGIGLDTLPEIAEKAAQASSMKGNPVVLTLDELVGILEEAL